MRNPDPRTKILMIICISAAAMMTARLTFLLGLLAASILILFLMGVGFKRQKKQLFAVLGMVIFLFLLQTIFGHWQTGIVLSVRLLVLLMSALILLTGEPRDYLLAMVQCHMPYELAYLVILAFHFFPLLREEALDILYSIQLRGTELEKTSIRKKINAYRKMCIPVFIGAMERAKDTATAMEARGFRSKRKRTYMRRLRLRAADVVMMILLPLMTAGFVLGAYFWEGPGDEFIVVGDVQYVLRDRDTETWGDFLGSVVGDNEACFALFTGDMVNNPADEDDWDAFFKNEKKALGDTKIYTAPGNHETCITPEKYLDKMELPHNGPLGEEFYSFDYENCHIVSLNSCLFMKERKSVEGYEEDVEAVHDWLEKDLSGSDADFKIVFMHHPLYPLSEDSGIYDALRENWEQIFINSGVDVVFCGHQHAYARNTASGVTYIMSTSGQKPSWYIDEDSDIPDYVDRLYEAPVVLKVKMHERPGEGSTLTVKAVNEDNEVIDKYSVNSK